MTTQFRYSAFISYASDDLAWAEKLHEELEARGVDAFLDRDRLVVGRAWEPQLVQALQQSRHLVVVWSAAAKSSDWVHAELGRFSQIVDPNGNGLTGERGIFALLLEGWNTTLVTTQMISDLVDAGAYPGDPATVGAPWSRAVTKISTAIHSEDDALPIPVLIVTTTSQRAAEKIDLTRVPPDGPALADLLADLDIPVDRFRSAYGTTRRDWRPFGSDKTIEEILASLKGDLNQDIEAASVASGEDLPRFRWDFVPEEFWSAIDVAEHESLRLARQASVVVVDPLSFYDELVVSRYGNYVSDILNNDAAFVLVLSPFSPSRSQIALRDAIRRFARQLFAHFYQPPAFMGRRYARCGPSIDDSVEFRGWLTAALAAHVGPGRATRHPFLEVASRRR